MNIVWRIDKKDISIVKELIDSQSDNAFVINRIHRNVKRNISPVTKEIFWQVLLSALVTTQQRSGPNTVVTKFLSEEPFSLNFSICSQSEDLTTFIQQTLSKLGIWRAYKISEYAYYNYRLLENGVWEQIIRSLSNLYDESTPEMEIQTAESICILKGIGPKQSRNILQALGITKYEIPIDSRITKWLNKNGFPIHLSATALADKNYYNFVMEGIKELCKAADILPCILDAAIFSSTDGDWPQEQLIW